MTLEANEFERRCAQLVGKDCWSIIAGSGAGSVLSIDFGRKLRRKDPLINPNRTSDQKEFVGEIRLFVECVWRLDNPTEIVCGAWDDNTESGPMLRGLKKLIGHVVSGVLVKRPGLDLEVAFSNQLKLTLFCDQVDEEDNVDNYSLSINRVRNTVGSRSRLSEGTTLVTK